MDSRIRVAFLALVVTQIAHSVEEYVFHFYEVFPAARFLNDLVPGFANPGFIIFNTADKRFQFLFKAADPSRHLV